MREEREPQASTQDKVLAQWEYLRITRDSTTTTSARTIVT